ncbi:tetraacyldisaccharide 4'-kinase [Marinicauda salina]|uniref:Tetraacyldisaccharide 4'-kinase n=1 Tax=Marinicauda salina TaxID=2135793 RepID=A0A2U2BUQ8_9PROT|nr:tetraacyldisaccharide 4'-kinase [Marinicauda salina]PWE17694.1 tetraacyldisaccharide 4'-kinase [Marinicauda salina]
MRPPAFWDADAPRGSARLTRALLAPASAVYAWATARRIARTRPARAPVPVICVGNLTLGGTGKTPVARALLEIARDQGRSPAALSRGWRGRLKGPVMVDPALHTAADVGDEPLLLAATAPTVVSRDRPAGARLAAEHGADLVVMDDGHQNPTLAKDLSIVVVDGETGWGAGRVFPAGPLREPVAAGLARADAVVVMVRNKDDRPDYAGLGLAELDIPVLTAWLEPAAPPPDGPLVAFAGIGRPQKFYDALAAQGGELAEVASFPDHHAFTRREIDALTDLAEAHDARLITTEKDWVRLPADARERVAAWPVRAVFAEPARIADLVADARPRVDAAREQG